MDEDLNRPEAVELPEETARIETAPVETVPEEAAPEETAPIETVVLSSNDFEDEPADASKKKSNIKTIAALVVLASVLGGFSLGAGIGFAAVVAGIILPKPTVPVSEEKPAESVKSIDIPAFSDHADSVLSADENMPGSFREIVKRVEPSVVNISAVTQGNQNFFGMPDMPRGSGIIFKEDEEKVYVVTNYHVVSEAVSVSVSVQGSEYVEAGLVGKEPQSDLAVIFLMKSDLAQAGVENVTVAKFGNSDNMQVGDIVLAIGNALGEGNTTTQGIISAKNKDINVENIELTVLQIDAAINPGNSGGPLVNMSGEVVGINTAKTMQQYLGSSAEGMGYSIASNIIVPIVDDIMLMKPKAFLGIRGNTVSQMMAEQFNIPELGVFVEEVIAGSAAEAAGLQRTDIITGFRGEPVFDMQGLQDKVKECAVGEDVEIKILRDGKNQVTLNTKMLASDDGNF